MSRILLEEMGVRGKYTISHNGTHFAVTLPSGVVFDGYTTVRHAKASEHWAFYRLADILASTKNKFWNPLDK